jgi:tetraacyldisaccharide-1-P 4'-kinase
LQTATEIENILKQRECVLDELIKTEKDYVKDLSEIVNGFVCFIIFLDKGRWNIIVPSFGVSSHKI